MFIVFPLIIHLLTQPWKYLYQIGSLSKRQANVYVAASVQSRTNMPRIFRDCASCTAFSRPLAQHNVQWDNLGCISSLARIPAYYRFRNISSTARGSPLGNFGMAIQTMDRDTRIYRQEKLKGEIFSAKYFVLTSVRHRQGQVGQIAYLQIVRYT